MLFRILAGPSCRKFNRILQINMLDHVIVGQSFEGRPGSFSFKEASMI